MIKTTSANRKPPAAANPMVAHLSLKAIASILVGVAFDALTDRTMNRNLFPIEMVIFFILGLLFAMPGALLGFLAGRFLGASERLGKAVAGLAVLASFALTLYRVL